MDFGASSEDVVGVLLIIVVITIIIFLIFREIFCWYWKINKRIEILEENNKLLSKIALLLEKPNIDDYNSGTSDSIDSIFKNDKKEYNISYTDDLDYYINEGILTIREFEVIKSKVQKMKSGYVIVRRRSDNKIGTMTYEAYQSMINKDGKNEFVLIARKK
jgi:uncharacterized protein YpmB